MGDEILKQIAVKFTEMIRNSVTIDWSSRESVQARMRVNVKRLLRKYGYPPDGRDKALQIVMKQAEFICNDEGVIEY